MLILKKAGHTKKVEKMEEELREKGDPLRVSIHAWEGHAELQETWEMERSNAIAVTRRSEESKGNKLVPFSSLTDTQVMEFDEKSSGFFFWPLVRRRNAPKSLRQARLVYTQWHTRKTQCMSNKAFVHLKIDGHEKSADRRRKCDMRCVPAGLCFVSISNTKRANRKICVGKKKFNFLEVYKSAEDEDLSENLSLQWKGEHRCFADS
jgi:hypothetical protein